MAEMIKPSDQMRRMSYDNEERMERMRKENEENLGIIHGSSEALIPWSLVFSQLFCDESTLECA
ncbi:hypothetical protein JHK86_006854 [Glycine max]|nr:hypothetical protein JHK86_006854 [Glycine max]